MGTSVFHGAMSTFLAVVSLSGSKSYIFGAFYRMWIGIIIFGVCNGFILLPIMLSLSGPLRPVNTHDKPPHIASTEEIEKINEEGEIQIVDLQKPDGNNFGRKKGVEPIFIDDH